MVLLSGALASILANNCTALAPSILHAAQSSGGVLLLNIGGDQTGIDWETLTPKQAFLHVTQNRRVKHIAFAEAAMGVLGNA